MLEKKIHPCAYVRHNYVFATQSNQCRGREQKHQGHHKLPLKSNYRPFYFSPKSVLPVNASVPIGVLIQNIVPSLTNLTTFEIKSYTATWKEKKPIKGISVIRALVKQELKGGKRPYVTLK